MLSEESTTIPTEATEQVAAEAHVPESKDDSPAETLVENAALTQSAPATESTISRNATCSSSPLLSTAQHLPPTPTSGFYFIRTIHNTFMSLRKDGTITLALSTAVGNFERICVRYATTDELLAFVAYKKKQKEAPGGDAWVSADGVVVSDPKAMTNPSFSQRGSSFVLHEGDDGEDNANGFPLVVLQSIPSRHYVGMSNGGSVLRQMEHVGPQEMFTIRPHTKLRPLGVHWILRNEAFETNLEALPPIPTRGDAANEQSSNQSAFDGIKTLVPWCGFEFVAIDDCFTHREMEVAKNETLKRQESAVSAASASSSVDGLTRPSLNTRNPSMNLFRHLAAVLPNPKNTPPLLSGIYTVSGISANAKLAIAGRGETGLHAVAVGDVAHESHARLKILARPMQSSWGRKFHTYSIGSLDSDIVIGLEKHTLHTRSQAKAWEEWEIAPHPTVPFHHFIRNIAFDKYLCLDPSQKLSNGMVIRVADKPGLWEAFYIGDSALMASLV